MISQHSTQRSHPAALPLAHAPCAKPANAFFTISLFLLTALSLAPPPTTTAAEPRVEVKYPYGPDSFRHDGVPQGQITEHVWRESKVFPGTIRRYWTYIPA